MLMPSLEQAAMPGDGRRTAKLPRLATRRRASSSASAPPSSLPSGAARRVDHVGAIPLTGDLTAVEESMVKALLYLCTGCHVGSVDPRVPPISESS
jgi:hypothetical protein